MSTRSGRRTIVLFEDHQDRIDDLQKEIAPLLGKKFVLYPFPLGVAPTSDVGPYEDRLVKALGEKVVGDIVLIVTDRDLSTKQWGGLSEAAVTKAAEKLGLPVACYRQARTNVEDTLRRKPGNGQLELPFPADERAKRIITLSNGFIAMEKLLNPSKAPAAGVAAKKASGKHKAKVVAQSGNGTPGTLLAGILKQPQVATKLDLFACGDQRAISEIMKVSTDDESPLSPAQKRSLVVALGVWLADLVMEFPGVLLNKVAAASYLDIAEADFEKKKVREVFAPALYKDLPFADEENPLWWRHTLDDLINEAEVVSGRALCEANGIKKIGFCPCSVQTDLHAGYYCMASQKPLSAQQSSGRVSWFPIGADLARLTAKTHRVLAPWIGS